MNTTASSISIALCALLFTACFSDAAVTVPKSSNSGGGGEIHEQLRPDNGVDRGVWGEISVCPEGDIVKSFEFKYDDLSNLDNTAGNGVKLYCTDALGGMTSYVTSAEGIFGEWRGIRACSGSSSVIVGTRTLVLGDQGTFHDDIGVTNIQMMCSDYQTLDGLDATSKRTEDQRPSRLERKDVVLPDGRHVQRVRAMAQPGDEPVWGDWVQCTGGYTVCGLQTRVEPEHIVDDDAGLSDIILFCC